MDGSNFCFQHQDITPEDHKDRWISKFLLAADGDPFLFQYDTHKQDRILGDLRDKIVVLTDDDILERIPPRRKYIDIYILLCENNYIKPEKHIGMYFKCLEYLSDFWVVQPNQLYLPLNLLAQKIRDTLLLRDWSSMHFFLNALIKLLKKPVYRNNIQEQSAAIEGFLNHLLESHTALKLSWVPFRHSLQKFAEDELGAEHSITMFLKNSYLPAFEKMYKLEKQVQKIQMDQCKEELIAYCWHPDRFEEWCLDEEEKAENRELFG